MTVSEADLEKLRRELNVQRQISFASGIFQADITINTLLESLAEGVIIIDSSGTILLVNTSAAEIFGYDRKDLIGQPHLLLIPESFREVHKQHEARYFEAPRRRHVGEIMGLTGLRSDGRQFPVEISLGFIETINGVLVLAFVSDITLRKEYEARLRESEELFHAQVECVQDYAIFMLDTQGNVLNWNAGAQRLTGYGDGDIIGKPFSTFYPQEELSIGMPGQQLGTAQEEGRMCAEGWRVHRDGSRFWSEEVITAVRDENERLRGFSIAMHDITERKRTEEVLRHSEARYRTLYRDNPMMIFTLDPQGTILSANPAAAHQLGYRIDELEGRPALDIFFRDDRPTVAAQLQNCLKDQGKVHSWQLRKVRKDGEMLWVEESAQVVHDLYGTVNVLLACQNITERKRAAEELRKSELKLSKMFQAVPAMVAMTTLTEGRCIDVNEACLRTLGYERDEMIGFTFVELGVWKSEVDRKRVVQLLEEQGRIRDLEIEFRDKYGNVVTGLFSAECLHLDGQPYMLSLVLDISERKRAEEALHRRTAELEAVVGAFPDLYFWIDADERILEYKAGAVTDLYVAPEEFLGRRMQDVLPPEVGQQLHEAVQQVFRTGCAAAADYWLPLKGEKQAYEARLLPLPGSRILFIVRNITQRKRAAEEIERLNTDLMAANNELEAFNYTVAHDLRKPLTTINGYCELVRELCNDALDEQCRDYLQKAQDSTWQMNRLIDTLLDFSRLTHIQPRMETTNLTGIVQAVAEGLKLAERSRRVTFKIAEGVTATGDPELLRVVIENLLGNAWKFTSTREEGIIEFGATEIAGTKVCFVRDNGVGFDMADREKLFAPFQRLTGAGESRGFGIGLATVQRIIRHHDGRVWAEAKPGKGATFYFTLDMKK